MLKIPWGNYQTDSFETKILYCLLLSVTTKFSSALQFKYQLNYLHFFEMKAVKAKLEKLNRQKPTNTISIVHFLQNFLFTEKF